MHLAFTGFVLWRLALAPCSGYCTGWALTWTPYEVVTLWWVGRFVEWLCIWVEGGQVRTVGFGSMFDAVDVRRDVRCDV